MIEVVPGGKRSMSDEAKDKLARKVRTYLLIGSKGEEVRRRDDRVGAKLVYGQHFAGVNLPKERSAIVANVTRALIMHKIAIMTKQQPIPIVEPNDMGDKEAARLMRNIIMNVFREDDMLIKLRKALLLAIATRTAAIKTVWDTTKHGGIGGIGNDVIPGWRLVLDGRCNSYDRMQFAGDKAVMPRPRAMMFYPQAAKEFEPQARVTLTAGLGQKSGSPIRDPWNQGGPLSPTGPTTINGKPTVTAFSGDPGFIDQGDDLVEIFECYHRDLTLYEDTEPDTDHLGNELKEVERDEEGMPQFDPAPPTQITFDDGTTGLMPQFDVRMKTKMKIVKKRVYPHWRRSTLLMPDAAVIDDIAWDGPLPYAFINDEEVLDGVWHRGGALQLETMQAMANVSLSVITDNLRMGSLQAWFASPQSGLPHKVLYPGPGQVIECDPNMIAPVQVPPISEAWFTHVNNLIALMERVIGATGIMQGEAAGRVDSASGYDTLAEIGGSRITECTQRMEDALGDWARNVGWFAQRFYSEKHAIAVEDVEGNITWERAWGPLLAGSMSYNIETGSTLAWTESAKFQRAMNLYAQGLIDKIAFYQRTNLSGWQEMLKRMATESPLLLGPAGGTPKQPKPPKAPAPKKGAGNPPPQ